MDVKRISVRLQGNFGKNAKETGISIQTSFDWRHKLLTSFSRVSIEEFQGIVESDDLFFTYSEKGNRHLDSKPKKRGKKDLDKILKEKLNKADVLCSGSKKSYGHLQNLIQLLNSCFF